MWTIRSASKLIHSANVIVAFLIIGSCGGHRPRIRPAISCLGAFWTPAARARGRVRHAGVQKPAQSTKADKTKETAPLALLGRAQLCRGQTRVASCTEICS